MKLLQYSILLLILAKVEPGLEVKLNKLVRSTASCHHIPALAVSIIYQNQSPLTEIVYSGQQPVPNSPKPKITTKTLFCQASLTKSLSAILMVRLAEEGYFSLDQSIESVLKRPFFAATPALNRITIRQILSHNTPVVANHVMSFFGFPYDNFSDLAEHLRYSESYRAKSTWNYNNALYSLTGYIAEQVVQNRESWFSLMRRKVLAPIGMADAKFIAQLTEADDVVMSSVRHDRSFHRISLARLQSTVNAVSPAMGLCASTRDMTKFLQFLSTGTGKSATGNQIISASAFSELISHQTPIRGTSAQSQITNDGYGLGWMLGTYRGHSRYSHNGFLYGYQSSVWVVPGLQTAIYVGISGSDLLVSGDFILTVLMDQIISELSYQGVPAASVTHPCQLAHTTLPQNALIPMQIVECARCPQWFQNEGAPQTASPQFPHSIAGVYKNPVLGSIFIELVNGKYPYSQNVWSIRFGKLGEAVLCPIVIDSQRQPTLFEVDIADPTLVLYFPNCNLCGTGLRTTVDTYSCKNLLRFDTNGAGFRFDFIDHGSPPYFYKL